MNFNKIIEVSYALINKHNADLRCRHFSFILDRNRIISIGLNSPKTHPLNLKYNYVNKNNEKISKYRRERYRTIHKKELNIKVSTETFTFYID